MLHQKQCKAHADLLACYDPDTVNQSMKWLNKTLKYALLIALIAIAAGAALLYGLYRYQTPRLPDVDSLRHVRFQVPLRIYTADHKLIAEFGEKKRIPVAFDQIPKTMVEAFLAAEDARFFEHPGVDYQGLLRAAIQYAMTGKRRQGGSTITMQVARNFFLTRKKTFTRKLNEILLALKIEHELSKQEILALYLNKIYLGNRAYGVAAAARTYYGKDLKDLSLAETAMIAGLPKAPSRFNPLINPKRALARRHYVLSRMHELGFLDDRRFAAADKAPLSARLHRTKTDIEAPYVAEQVRARLLERFGEAIYSDGYIVDTTLRAPLQLAARKALRNALDAYDKRHGWRGPENHIDSDDRKVLQQRLAGTLRIGDLDPAVVIAVKKRSARVLGRDGHEREIPWKGLKWAARHLSADRLGPAPRSAHDILRVGDLVRIREEHDKKGRSYWRLAQIPQVEGAFVSLDPRDGAILALVGGYDYNLSKFNRASQAKRQPGSGFKAYVYSAALENGFTPATIINDAPIVLDDASLETEWRPQNYSGRFFGPTRLRWALTKSRNLVSIRILRRMGIENALRHIAKFGFDPAELPHNLSLALGSGAITPLQMARGYAVFANGGYLVQPYLIARIRKEGEGEIERAQPATAPTTDAVAANPAPRVISPENRFLMYSMMQDVIKRGTATKARVLQRRDLAGKTGTTNDQVDAWFNGYNQSIVAIAWVGFDNPRPMGRGEVGGRAALPAWIEFMRTALKTIPDRPPTPPDTLARVAIDPKTGERARHGQKNAILEYFRPGNAPGRASAHGPDNGGTEASAEALVTPDDADDIF